MARYETRHADYLPYMRLYSIFREFEVRKIRAVTVENRVDAVTAPTEIYDVDFAFEFGMDLEQPVGTMTLLGAAIHEMALKVDAAGVQVAHRRGMGTRLPGGRRHAMALRRRPATA